MNDEVLIHHGIKGQRWGIRRFQNEDGTRTAAGRARERNGEQGTPTKSSSERKGLSDGQKEAFKKVAVTAGVAIVTGLAVYGASKYSDVIKEEAFKKSVEAGQEAMKALNKESLYRGVMLSPGLDKYQRINLSDKYNSVNRADFKDVMETAHKNSATFRAAVKTLSGRGQLSTPELNRMGISTIDSHRDEFNETLRKLVYQEESK